MITFTATDRAGANHRITGTETQSMMQAMKNANLPVRAICGGNGICSTCHILVNEQFYSAFEPPDEDELELLKETAHYSKGRSRLACQLPLASVPEGLAVTMAPE